MQGTVSERGARLGLPESGRGAAAPLSRRLLALLIDGAACALIASLYRGFRWESAHYLNVAVLFAEYVLLLPLGGQTFGMFLTRIRVVCVHRERLSPLWAAVRTLLLFLVVPAVVVDRDRRGLHDRASDTVVVSL